MSPYLQQILTLMFVSGILGIAAYVPYASGRMVISLGAIASGAAVVAGQVYALDSGGLVMAMGAAALVGGVAGLAMGVCFGHLSGLVFAVVTLAAGELAMVWAENAESIGGALGFTPEGIPTLSVGVSAALFGGALLSALLLEHNTEFRRKMYQVQEDPAVAISLGISPRRVQTYALVMSGVLAGLAGAMTLFSVKVVEPKDWGFAASIIILLYAVIGGRGHVLGAVLGAAFFTATPEFLQFSETRKMFWFGAAVVLLVALAPEGLLAKRPRRLVRQFAAKLRRARRNWS